MKGEGLLPMVVGLNPRGVVDRGGQPIGSRQKGKGVDLELHPPLSRREGREGELAPGVRPGENPDLVAVEGDSKEGTVDSPFGPVENLHLHGLTAPKDLPGRTVAVSEEDVQNLHLPASPPLRGPADGGGLPASEEKGLVTGNHLFRPAALHDLPLLQEHGLVADPLQGGQVVGDQKNRLPPAPEIEDLLEALLLEVAVPDGEDLVDQKNIGVDMNGDRKAEPDVHPR